MKALNLIGYGLYVVTCNDGKKDNGLIVNTVAQLTSNPKRVMVTINKANYSHDVIKETGKMNVNLLSEDAPFKVFQAFGFCSGRDVDKFADCCPVRSKNGLVVLPRYINSYLSLEVEQYLDLGTHGMFICLVTADQVFNDLPSMTYAYYHANVKPNAASAKAAAPAAEKAAGSSETAAPAVDGEAAPKKKGYVCTICGYVYEGDPLPADFVCPLCKHGAEDFVPIV